MSSCSTNQVPHFIPCISPCFDGHKLGCGCVRGAHISGQAQIILVAKYDISPFGHYIPINSDRLIPWCPKIPHGIPCYPNTMSSSLWALDIMGYWWNVGQIVTCQPRGFHAMQSTPKSAGADSSNLNPPVFSLLRLRRHPPLRAFRLHLLPRCGGLNSAHDLLNRRLILNMLLLFPLFFSAFFDVFATRLLLRFLCPILDIGRWSVTRVTFLYMAFSQKPGLHTHALA
jgi:hypothetical protein